MKHIIIVSLALIAASCSVTRPGPKTEVPLPSGEIITAAALAIPEMTYRQIKIQEPDGSLTDSKMPVGPTGKFLIRLAIGTNTIVDLPWPGSQPPKSQRQYIKATVLAEEKDGETVYTILKLEQSRIMRDKTTRGIPVKAILERTSGTIYERKTKDF